jgi:hypothetical protein
MVVETAAPTWSTLLWNQPSFLDPVEVVLRTSMMFKFYCKKYSVGNYELVMVQMKRSEEAGVCYTA